MILIYLAHYIKQDNIDYKGHSFEGPKKITPVFLSSCNQQLKKWLGSYKLKINAELKVLDVEYRCRVWQCYMKGEIDVVLNFERKLLKLQFAVEVWR